MRYAGSAGWEAGGRTIEQQSRPFLGGALPSVAVTIATLLLMVVALSIMLPVASSPSQDGLRRAAGLMRGALFIGGVALYALGAVSFLRHGEVGVAGAGAGEAPAAPHRPPGYTVVALGGAPDDTRAIADAADAAAAVLLMHGWRVTHPDERIIIFAPDGEPLAFRRPARPAWTSRAPGRGAA